MSFASNVLSRLAPNFGNFRFRKCEKTNIEPNISIVPTDLRQKCKGNGVSSKKRAQIHSGRELIVLPGAIPEANAVGYCAPDSASQGHRGGVPDGSGCANAPTKKLFRKRVDSAGLVAQHLRDFDGTWKLKDKPMWLSSRYHSLFIMNGEVIDEKGRVGKLERKGKAYTWQKKLLILSRNGDQLMLTDGEIVVRYCKAGALAHSHGPADDHHLVGRSSGSRVEGGFWHDASRCPRGPKVEGLELSYFGPATGTLLDL